MLLGNGLSDCTPRGYLLRRIKVRECNCLFGRTAVRCLWGAAHEFECASRSTCDVCVSVSLCLCVQSELLHAWGQRSKSESCFSLLGATVRSMLRPLLARTPSSSACSIARGPRGRSSFQAGVSGMRAVSDDCRLLRCFAATAVSAILHATGAHTLPSRMAAIPSVVIMGSWICQCQHRSSNRIRPTLGWCLLIGADRHQQRTTDRVAPRLTRCFKTTTSDKLQTRSCRAEIVRAKCSV